MVESKHLIIPSTRMVNFSTSEEILSIDTKKKKNVTSIFIALFLIAFVVIVEYINFFPGGYISMPTASGTTSFTTTAIFKNDTDIIPFYLYPPELFPSFWGANSSCDHSRVKTPKHDHEEFAYNAMKRHPWRRSDPKEASIAFLPLSLNLWKRNGCSSTIDKDQIRQEIQEALTYTGIFPTIRHVVFQNDFMTRVKDVNYILEILKPALITVYSEGRRDCSISVGHSSNYATENSLRKPNNFHLPDNRRFGANRIYSVHMAGQVDQREAYRHRAALFTSKGEIPNNPFILGSYAKKSFESHPLYDRIRPCNSSRISDLLKHDHDRCRCRRISRELAQSTQEKSNYTLCLRGDTLGSDRWINGMAAGTALIQVIADDSGWDWLPFPNIIPWKEFVITIWEKAYLKDPAGSIRKVMERISEERLLELQRLSLHYVADLDWMAHNSRVLENIIRDAYSVSCKAFDDYLVTSSSNISQ